MRSIVPAVMLLVVDAAALGGLADPRLLARCGRSRGFPDQGNQAVQRLLAVALLAALALGHQHQHTVAREPPPRQAFRGWMYAASPGLNPLEHPVYDAWLITCRAAAPPPTAQR